jgi:hypothetical protein
MALNWNLSPQSRERVKTVVERVRTLARNTGDDDFEGFSRKLSVLAYPLELEGNFTKEQRFSIAFQLGVLAYSFVRNYVEVFPQNLIKTLGNEDLVQHAIGDDWFEQYGFNQNIDEEDHLSCFKKLGLDTYPGALENIYPNLVWYECGPETAAQMVAVAKEEKIIAINKDYDKLMKLRVKVDTHEQGQEWNRMIRAWFGRKLFTLHGVPDQAKWAGRIKSLEFE